MANSSLVPEACPPPFLIGNNYPYVAGEQAGRLCEQSQLAPDIACCLPCPLSNSIYPNNFDSIYSGAQWLGVPALACTVLLLISFAVLPVQRTNRHYLTICLIIAIFILELAFIIPLGTDPNQCYDAITPNNMQSDVSCGFSGAFLLFGGFGGVVWVFIRSLSVHLQICWQYVPGTLFFYAAQIGGWGLTILVTVLALVLSGVSYRLGSTCHINHDKSIGTYWGPLLALAGLSLILQLITFIYCMKVYLQVAVAPKGAPSSNMSGTQVTTSSNRSDVRKRATYRRVREVIALQWRGMTVVVFVVITACYLATVFLLLDQNVVSAYEHPDSITPWVVCMVKTGGNKDTCSDLTSAFVLKEQVILPIPYLIVACGIWCLLFLGRWEMVLGWRDLIRQGFRPRAVSPSLRSQSQLSFRDRMQATPQQLHIIQGSDGLSVVRKNEHVDIEMTPPASPAHTDSQYDDEEEDDYPSPKIVQFQQQYPAQDRSISSPASRPIAPRSSSSNGHVSFNFSRPTVHPQASLSAIGQPRTSPPPQALPHLHSHTYSHSQSFAQSYHVRPHRSISNASSRWLMHDADSIDETVPAPAIPAKSLNRPGQGAYRSVSRSENDVSGTRASQGMAWDPTSSFASPVYMNRSQSGSSAFGGTYEARGYSVSGAGGYR